MIPRMMAVDENDQEAEVAEGDALDDDRFQQKASVFSQRHYDMERLN